MKLPIQACPVNRSIGASSVEGRGLAPSGCSAWDWIKCGATVAGCALACIDTVGAACIACMGPAYNSCKDCL